eukprot:TRINITY_DN1669_c0_g1_i15.p1 TRINITY_DN1669_c0_g1~~TRINITY_DN1669_c0_g1_i15.p1  ORF type:complete len:160 (-),score=13.97 TRINITY_DN1669_c0_g1_i15:530-1009(-)
MSQFCLDVREVGSLLLNILVLFVNPQYLNWILASSKETKEPNEFPIQTTDRTNEISCDPKKLESSKERNCKKNKKPSRSKKSLRTPRNAPNMWTKEETQRLVELVSTSNDVVYVVCVSFSFSGGSPLPRCLAQIRYTIKGIPPTLLDRWAVFPTLVTCS